MNSRCLSRPICIRSLPAKARSQYIELAAIRQRRGLHGVRSRSVSGSNSRSQGFPGGATSRHCERVSLEEKRCLRHLQLFELARHRALRAALVLKLAQLSLRPAVRRRGVNKRDQPRAARDLDHAW
jgi:hypothetical protein